MKETNDMKKNMSIISIFILLSIFLINCKPSTDSPVANKVDTPDQSEEQDSSLKDLAARQHQLNNLKSIYRLMPRRQSFTLDTAKKNTLSGRKGTHLVVPPDSFIDTKGKPVKGTVTVSLTEAVDSIDILGTNIPMVYYDNNGKKYQFESAGMFRVSASQGNKGLMLAKNRKIEVNFPNRRPGTRFNVYRLDSRGRWVHHGHNQEMIADGGASFRKYKIDWLTWWNFDHPTDQVACLTGTIEGVPLENMNSFMIKIVGIDKLQVDRGIILGNTFRINSLINSKVKILLISDGKLAGQSKIISVWDKIGDKQGKKSGVMCQNIGTLAVKKDPVPIRSNYSLREEVGITDVMVRDYAEAFDKQQEEAAERARRSRKPVNIPTL
jgi:hypothetical protein